jgi:hypothetical protein
MPVSRMVNTLGWDRAYESFVSPTTHVRPLEKLLKSSLSPALHFLAVGNPFHFFIPPLVKLVFAAEFADAADKFVRFRAVDLAAMDEDIRQWVVAWFAVGHGKYLADTLQLILKYEN